MKKGPENNIKVTEPSGTPSEHQGNLKGDDPHFQLIKAMMSGKGPGFPARGISEISGRSGMSIGPLIDRKFHTASLRKPQTSRMIQRDPRDSGEAILPQHNNQIVNERNKDHFNEELSRRPS